MDEVSSFTLPLVTVDVGRAEQYRPIRMILRPFSWRPRRPDMPRQITVPAGFCCDGASTPFPANAFVEPWGVYAQAAIVHDFLYASHLVDDRLAADREFREGIESLGTTLAEPNVKRPFRSRLAGAVAFAAVRAFAMSAWLNGAYTYEARAGQVRRRLLEKGEDELAKMVIADARLLIDASTRADGAESMVVIPPPPVL